MKKKFVIALSVLLMSINMFIYVPSVGATSSGINLWDKYNMFYDFPQSMTLPVNEFYFAIYEYNYKYYIRKTPYIGKINNGNGYVFGQTLSNSISGGLIIISHDTDYLLNIYSAKFKFGGDSESLTRNITNTTQNGVGLQSGTLNTVMYTSTISDYKYVGMFKYNNTTLPQSIYDEFYNNYVSKPIEPVKAKFTSLGDYDEIEPTSYYNYMKTATTDVSWGYIDGRRSGYILDRNTGMWGDVSGADFEYLKNHIFANEYVKVGNKTKSQILQLKYYTSDPAKYSLYTTEKLKLEIYEYAVWDKPQAIGTRKVITYCNSFNYSLDKLQNMSGSQTYTINIDMGGLVKLHQDYIYVVVVKNLGGQQLTGALYQYVGANQRTYIDDSVKYEWTSIGNDFDFNPIDVPEEDLPALDLTTGINTGKVETGDELTGVNDFYNDVDEYTTAGIASITNTLGGLENNIGSFFTLVWGIFPAEIWGIIIAGISVLIVVGIVKAII